ncbi:MAG TPA: hypothetical protein VMU48_11640 [Terracidiphilus sp.]|nr:hypothetical protein [Terracidiphilus sp.]
MKRTFAPVLATAIALAGMACGPGFVPAAQAQAVGPHIPIQDIAAVQADSNFSSQTFPNCTAFDRLVTPPLVSAFTIPAGKVFVVTSIDWSANIASLASKSMYVAILSTVSGFVNGPTATSVAMADSAGVGGGNVTFPTGFIVQPNQKLCIQVEVLGTTETFAASGVAHGYFADAQPWDSDRH